MRIWVTGLGAVTPLGRTAEETMAALVAGERAIGPITLFDPTGCRSEIGAQLPELRVSDVAPAGAGVSWSRTDAMAVIAAREALAELDHDAPIDLVLGGTTAGMFETEDLLAEMHQSPSARQPLLQMLSHPLSAPADRMQTAVRRFRRARTLCSACSSGANALLLAAAWLRTGHSDRVLAGGADGLCRLTFTGFSCLGALSPAPCRPFDVARDGLNLGEGAAFLLLETEDAARRRGAEPIVELRGWATASEAHHITNPQASGETASAVMRAALARAGIAPTDVDYINAHGTATKLNDKMESSAIRAVFGDDSARVAVSSSKGQIGHTLGAAGAVEAAICAMAIRRGVVPPTAGLVDVDPECQLNHVFSARQQPIRAALSNSFGFGGSDATILLVDPTCFDAPPSGRRRRAVVTASATVGTAGVLDHHGAAIHLEPGEGPPDGPLPFEAGAHLDLGRARRLDRSGRLVAAAIGAALDASGMPATDAPRTNTGAIMNGAYGSVDSCSAFIHRVFEKGAKLASPAVFPNLLPSSPVAHASIYHRLAGPVFASADLDATSESAVVTAAELIMAGEADAIFAGGIEEASVITEAVLGPLCSGPHESKVERSEGAAVLLVEAAEAVAARGARPIAEISWWCDWRGDPKETLSDAPLSSADPRRTAVLVAHLGDSVASALAGSRWESAPRLAAGPRVGSHECAGGFAAAAGVARLAAGDLDELLVLGLAPDRGYAFVLRVVDTED